jgi:hypothetical protein
VSSQTEDDFIASRWHVELTIPRLISCGRAHSIAAEFDYGGFSERHYLYGRVASFSLALTHQSYFTPSAAPVARRFEQHTQLQ